jgi:hypothetical protein
MLRTSDDAETLGDILKKYFCYFFGTIFWQKNPQNEVLSSSGSMVGE